MLPQFACIPRKDSATIDTDLSIVQWRSSRVLYINMQTNRLANVLFEANSNLMRQWIRQKRTGWYIFETILMLVYVLPQEVWISSESAQNFAWAIFLRPSSACIVIWTISICHIRRKVKTSNKVDCFMWEHYSWRVHLKNQSKGAHRGWAQQLCIHNVSKLP